MRASSLAILALVMGSPMLGGCQSIFGISRSAKIDILIPEKGDPAEYAASQMAVGRAALSDHQFGLAIIAFRNARRAPEHTAAANNGLAIAYAQIGRADLAERYFKQAIADAPGNRSYHANLARFYASVPNSPVRMARSEALENPKHLPQEPVTQILSGTAKRSAIRIEQPAQQIVRISAKEVRIGTRTDPRRRALQPQAAAPKPVRRVDSTYPIRIEFSDRNAPVRAGQSATQYPIRIEFGERDTPITAKQSARQNPVRVSLAPSN